MYNSIPSLSEYSVLSVETFEDNQFLGSRLIDVMSCRHVSVQFVDLKQNSRLQRIQAITDRYRKPWKSSRMGDARVFEQCKGQICELIILNADSFKTSPECKVGTRM